jgi:hypothetical protein
VGVLGECVPVEVPAAASMSDENFCRHMNLRHEKDMGGASLQMRGALKPGTSAAVATYRAFHDRLHALEIPGQYDHVHAG